MKRLIPVLGALSVMLSAAAIALACGIVIDKERVDPKWRQNVATMVHKEFKVDVKLRDQVAEVTVKPVFHNPNDFAVEGTYFLSLPTGAQVKDFSMTVGGKEHKAELLDSGKARQVYHQMVQAQRDPALLELVGSQMLKASLSSVAPKTDVAVTVSYTVLVKNEAGIVEVDIPFSNQFVGDQPVPLVSVSMDIQSKVAIKNVYSPTHSVDVARKNDNQAKVSYEAQNYNAKKAFKVYYTLSDDDMGLTLMTFREGGQDGFFMLLASPRVKVEEAQIVPKDVVFVMDRSGSMSGEKIQQARQALGQCIDSLNAKDRFNIVDFSSEASAWEKEPCEASRENRARAQRYVEGLRAAGSTNIKDALETSLAQLPKDGARLQVILFCTDGLPTVGEQDMSKILTFVKGRDASHVRIFSFGVGNDVNTQFLDRLAEENRGDRDYVAPEEKIEAKIGVLFDKISSPVLANLAVDFGKDMKLKDVYPRRLPDLFKGTQLVVFGRYEGQGPTTVTLQGIAGVEPKMLRYEVNLPEKDLRNDFLPRLWAARKIAFLVDSIRLNGNAKEVLDEIVSLGKKYGIVTPYTSFLITEEQKMGMEPGDHNESAKKELEEQLGRLEKRAENSGKPAPATGGGGGAPAERPAQAQADSADLKKAKDGASADKLDDVAREVRRKSGGKGGVKVVGNKTFFSVGGIWVDTLFDAKSMKDIVKVVYLSADYFKLLEEQPEMAKYFSVGEQIIVVWNAKVYQATK